MNRIQLERIALANGVDATVIASLDFRQLLAAVEAQIRKAAERVPAGVDIADHKVADKYEQLCSDILVAEGISFIAGNASDDFGALVEKTVAPNNGGNAPAKGTIVYKGNTFQLAEKRNERSRKAVVKFLEFAEVGTELTSATGTKYYKLIVTAVVFDAQGKGTQNNYTVNSSLMKALQDSGLFKGVKKTASGCPILTEPLFAMVQLSENEANVTTWGSDDATHIAAAEKAGTLVYTEKGAKQACVFHREDSVQESLDKIVGLVDPATVNRLKEGQMTQLELEGARHRQELAIGTELQEMQLDALKKNAAKMKAAYDALIDAGIPASQAEKMAFGK